MSRLAQIAATLATSTLLTITLSFGLCIVLAFAMFGGGIDLGPIVLLVVAALLAVLVAFVCAAHYDSWIKLGLSLRFVVAILLVQYAFAWVTAIVFWMILTSL
ncbi:MAG TPA: hypothetical protein VKT77_17260 [Chthonomonadaceae bacterium]|nr:hypothetical protein [Chthonomonadaceae bacterium]